MAYESEYTLLEASLYVHGALLAVLKHKKRKSSVKELNVKTAFQACSIVKKSIVVLSCSAWPDSSSAMLAISSLALALC